MSKGHSRPIRVLNAITSTDIGGAQSMLVKLLEARWKAFDGFDQSVLSLRAPGELGTRLARGGVAVHTLGMRYNLPGPIAIARLIALSHTVAPKLLVGWMHHAGIAAWCAASVHRPKLPVIWNIRHSLSDIAYEKASTRLILRQSARLSRRIDALIFNSRVARAQYSAFGYMTDRATVIPNGFDSKYFRPHRDARARLTRLFRMEGTRPIIGMVARNHPMKDPATLINAMRRLWAAGQEADLLIVGPGMEKLADGARISGDRITLSGARDDLADWLPGLDLLVLPSAWGEAFPNIIGEAMACGVTCVATDVGDSQWIIGEHGLVVPPGAPEAMQAAIAKLLQLSPDARRALGLAGRARVIQQFSLPAIAQDYAALYGSVVDSWQSRVRAGVPLGSVEFP